VMSSLKVREVKVAHGLRNMPGRLPRRPVLNYASVKGLSAGLLAIALVPKKEKGTLVSIKRHLSMKNAALKKDFARSATTKQTVSTNTIYLCTFKIHLMIKRIFDISLAIVGFFLALPLLMLITLIHMITMPGPLFYLQTRTGYKGKCFTIFKFRTMVVNKDDIVITVDSDKRITSFGQILRATKFDELPQLWNILKGDMSFVGPRPDVPGYYDHLTGDDRIVLDVKPGLTGADSIAYTYEEIILGKQEDPVKFYNEKLFPDKVRINKAYVFRQSLKLDITIILFTLFGRQLSGEEFKPRFK